MYEIEDLKDRLREAEETLDAIRSGAVDALVVSAPEGEQVYTLRGAQHPYRVFFERMNEGGVVISREGLILACNTSFAHMIGADLEKLCGSSFYNFILPKDRPGIRRLVKNICETENLESSRRNRRGETALLASGGREVPIQLALSTAHEIENAHVCIVITDLTDQKRAEKELRRASDELDLKVRERTAELEAQNRELMQAEDALREAHKELERRVEERTAQVREQSRILDTSFLHAHTCLVLLDRNFNYLRVNKAFANVCRREISDFVGHNHFIDYPSEELMMTFQQVVDTKSPCQAYARPFVFPSHPETTYWDLTAAPIVSERGEVELLIVSLLDVTERGKLQEEALRAARLASIGELAAGVAHEINNPINSIINYAEIIAQQTHRDAPQYPMAEEIKEEGWRIASIVKGLLSFARDTKGRKIPVAARDIVSAALVLTGAVMRKEAITLRLTVPDDLPAVLGNAQELQQVVLNIINNARY
ncbi:MAG TPA: PAS domain S-box protein, partial [Dissulfurispiraceae bacterium]|nr:PAS domain S-box protein [Dissulfurispiraceae bacterium]